MQKTLIALSAAAFVIAGFAASAPAAPVQLGTSITASHNSLTVVKATKKTAKKSTAKKSSKKKAK